MMYIVQYEVRKNEQGRWENENARNGRADLSSFVTEGHRPSKLDGNDPMNLRGALSLSHVYQLYLLEMYVDVVAMPRLLFSQGRTSFKQDTMAVWVYAGEAWRFLNGLWGNNGYLGISHIGFVLADLIA